MGLVAANRQQGELLIDGDEADNFSSTFAETPFYKKYLSNKKFPRCGAVCVHSSKSGCLLAAGGGDGVAINQSWAGGLVRARAWRWPLLLYPVPGTHTHNTPQ